MNIYTVDFKVAVNTLAMAISLLLIQCDVVKMKTVSMFSFLQTTEYIAE